MDQKKPFPLIANRDVEILCFNCRAPITRPYQASGYAQGRGSMRAQCGHCKMITHFDYTPIS